MLAVDSKLSLELAEKDGLASRSLCYGLLQLLTAINVMDSVQRCVLVHIFVGWKLLDEGKE